jgi:amino acid adenylation domain-containing protein
VSEEVYILPTSYAQQRLWILDQLEPGNPAYNMPSAVRLTGTLNTSALLRGINEVIRRHEVLRTTFAPGDGGPSQVIRPELSLAVPVIDLSQLPASLCERESERVMAEESQQSFDLQRGPLVRATLLRRGAQENVLLLSFHHIVSDGWSLAIFVEELTELYACYSKGVPSTLPDLPVQYADYALWQRDILQGDQFEAQLAYWKKKLEGPIATLELPCDSPRPAIRTFRGESLSFDLSQELSESIKALTRSEGATLFMTLLAALKVLLHRYTAQSDIVVGAPIATRSVSEVERLIGCFLNTLVLRTDLSGNPSFREALARVREVTLGAYANQEVPFEKLLEELRVTRPLDRTPLFQVFFNVLNFPETRIELPGLAVEVLTIPEMDSKFDLTIYVSEHDGRIKLTSLYNAGLFTQERMKEMLRQYEALLLQIVAGPDLPVAAYSLVTEAARRLLPDPCEELSDLWQGAVHTLFSRQAARNPARIAAVDRYEAWTYDELNVLSNQLAHYLIASGIEPEDRVAIYAHRSATLVWALLGVLKAGAAFVVLDPAYPPARLVEYLRISRPRGWIAVEAAGEIHESVEEALSDIGCQCRLVLPRKRVALATGLLEGELTDDPCVRVGTDSLAYVAFTSGSTGMPKGVLGRHGPLTHFLPWLEETFGLSVEDRFSMVSGLSHDPLHRDVFTPLTLGATVSIPEREDIEAPGGLARWMRDAGITIAHLTPAMGQVLTEIAGDDSDCKIASLRYAFFVGDVLTRHDVTRLKKLAPSVVVVNYYGTTETQRAVGYFIAADHRPRQSERDLPAARVEKEILPLGKGIRDVQLLVLGGSGQLAGVGEIGEIYLRSPHLARGYIGNDDLTAERFLSNPFTGSGGDRLYRTGDLGRYRTDGILEPLGRADHQIKIRGFRIEPGEIESLLAAHHTVRECVVIAREDTPGNKLLVAYLIARQGQAPIASELRAYLKEQLPDYMVPAAFVKMDAFPVTPNGKLDRRALPAPDEECCAGDHSGPQNRTEELLAEIWAEVLGRRPIGIRDNFFELGGHSLLATRLIARVQEAFQMELPLRSLFAAPTIAELASTIEGEKGERKESPGFSGELPEIGPAPDSRYLPFPLNDIQQAYWIGRVGGIELGNIASHRYIEFECMDLDIERFSLAWQKLIERHDMLRAIVHPDGHQQVLDRVTPYRIEVEDLRSRDPDQAAACLAALRQRMSHQVMATDRWPLFEIRASLLDDRRTRIHFSFDFLIADAWSFRILTRELSILYGDPQAGLPPLDLSFRDYVLAEAELQQTDSYKRSQEYWRGRLDSLPPAPDLPLARNPALLTQPRFARRSASLDAQTWEALKSRAARAGLTASNILLAAFSEVLAAWSKSPRFTIVLTLFNRLPLHEQVDQIIGDFTSTTLLAVESTQSSFEQRARAIQEQLLSDLDHRYVSGVRVLRDLARTRGGALRAVMPVVFTSTLTQSAREPDSFTIKGELVYGVSQTPQVWLDHQVFEREGALVFNWDAIDELAPEGLLDDMFDSYCRLLERLADQQQSWDATGRQLLPAAQLEQREAVNATQAPVSGRLLHELFAAQVARRRLHPAVITPTLTFTYDELDRRSEQVARWLRRKGARPNNLVAIVMEKGWEQVVAALGILKSGAAYLPIDASLPGERLRYLLNDGEASLVLTQSRVEERAQWPDGLERLCIDTIEPQEMVADSAWPYQAEEDLAYVIYTSGSTGLPKGVMIDHRGAVNTILDINRRFDVGTGDRVLAISSLGFDLSVYDIFGLLAAGGAIVIPDAMATRDPSHWLDLIERERVTIWNSVPALVGMLARYAADRLSLLPRGLRLVMMSGDWIPMTLPDEIRGLTRDCLIVSLGGATEASIWSILYPIEKVDGEWKSIPYGRPMANQTFHVLDEAMGPRPVWVPGQLYIGGIGVAKGYWKNEEKTRSSFVIHPRTGERLYRTGDLGRYLPDGNIEFLGREDFQVKIQGYRIELGEVEAALSECPGVRSAVVVAAGGPRGNKRLVGYVVPEQEGLTAARLRDLLREKLPEYMVPQTILMMDSLPLTQNGKVNRQALPPPDSQKKEMEGDFIAPRSPAEQVLAEIWSELLGVERPGVRDNFFDAGGDSLVATQLVTRAGSAFNVELTFRGFFASPTIEGLAACLEEAILARSKPENIDELLDLLESIDDSDVEQMAILGEEAKAH